ncbi:tRNA (guanosine(37)-N1)-methyltransferase TrmD [Candidatus Kaiserbacteria bacterium]|nr:tRNA (guanosine(37)-N1)-methyltransferase TrmD [Candidatus Kaiserbacteria bacterium]
MVHFHIVTLFPESIEPYLSASMIGRAQEFGKIKVSYYDPKDYMDSPKDRVDRRPYGGGPGMVLEPEAMLRAAQAAIGRKKDVEVIFFSTEGETFTEAVAQELATRKHVVFICGHYEGVDARVAEILNARWVTMGPYVLTGGELPAATIIDAVSRFVPGVLGKAESLEASRVSSPAVYTRPDVLKWKGKKYPVPEVLKSGHHAKIDEWKRGTRKSQ